MKKVKKVKEEKGNKKTNKDQIKKAKKDQRLKNVDHQLYEQMKMLHERIGRMDNDKELYYLINFKEEKNSYYFEIVKKDEEDKQLKITVNNKWETTCNCMDWRIRCRGMAIACKHIYYLL